MDPLPLYNCDDPIGIVMDMSAENEKLRAENHGSVQLFFSGTDHLDAIRMAVLDKATSLFARKSLAGLDIHFSRDKFVKNCKDTANVAANEEAVEIVKKRKKANTVLSRKKAKKSKGQHATSTLAKSDRTPVVPYQGLVVGSRLKVYYEAYDKWFLGTVQELEEDGDRVDVAYDDGDNEWMDPCTTTWKFSTKPFQPVKKDLYHRRQFVARQKVGQRLHIFCPMTQDYRFATLVEINKKCDDPHSRNAPHRLVYDHQGGEEWTNLTYRQFSRLNPKAEGLEPKMKIGVWSEEGNKARFIPGVLLKIDPSRAKPHLVSFVKDGQKGKEWMNLWLGAFRLDQHKKMKSSPVVAAPTMPAPIVKASKSASLPLKKRVVKHETLLKKEAHPVESLETSTGVADFCRCEEVESKRERPKRLSIPKWNPEEEKLCIAKRVEYRWIVATNVADDKKQPDFTAESKVHSSAILPVPKVAGESDLKAIGQTSDERTADERVIETDASFSQATLDEVCSVCKPSGNLPPVASCKHFVCQGCIKLHLAETNSFICPICEVPVTVKGVGREDVVTVEPMKLKPGDTVELVQFTPEDLSKPQECLRCVNMVVKAYGNEGDPEDRVEKGRPNPNLVLKSPFAVEQVDFQHGDTLKTFSYIFKAVKAMGMEAGDDSIRKVCCLMGKESAKGFFWRFKGSEALPTHLRDTNNVIEIRTTRNGKVVKEFSTVNEAQVYFEYQCSLNKIRDLCRSNSYALGVYWNYRKVRINGNVRCASAVGAEQCPDDDALFADV